MKCLVLAFLLAAVGTGTLAQGPPAPGRGTGVPPSANVADAKPGDVRLIVSNGLRAPLEAVKPQAQQAVARQMLKSKSARS